MKSTVAIIIILLAGWGCSNKPTVQEIAAPVPKKAVNTETTSIETKQIAIEQKAEYVTEIKFSKNKFHLSLDQKRKIDKVLKKAINSGAIEEVKVISWADRDLPSDESKKLSKQQIAVADERNEAIEGYIKGRHDNLKIKTYSMAQRASAFKEFIGASEARIQKSLAGAGIGGTQASKSIVMIITQ